MTDTLLDLEGTNPSIHIMANSNAPTCRGLLVTNSNSGGAADLALQNDTWQTIDLTVYGTGHANVDSFGLGAGYAHLRAAYNCSGLIVSTSGETAPLIFGTGQAERVRIDVQGHVGIGTTTPAAVLDITSTTSGFLPPRMTQAQRDAIASPPEGSTIYNLTSHKLNVFTGSSWETVASS